MPRMHTRLLRVGGALPAPLLLYFRAHSRQPRSGTGRERDSTADGLLLPPPVPGMSVMASLPTRAIE